MSIRQWPLDSSPFDRDGTFTICVISILSISQAALLVLWPVSGHATAVFALIVSLSAIFGQHQNVVAAIMAGSAILALAGALLKMGWPRLAIFAPQQFLLFAMALGGLVAAYDGAYLDGTVIAWSHILSDQLVTVGLFAIHWHATVRRSRDPNG
jgi:hypothetical protein